MKKTLSTALAAALLVVSGSAWAQDYNYAGDPAVTDEKVSDNNSYDMTFGSVQFNRQPNDVGVAPDNYGTSDAILGRILTERKMRRADQLVAVLDRESQMAGQVGSCPCPSQEDQSGK